MKSISIAEAFFQEIKRKTVWAKDNELYVFVFMIVVFFIGTIGLWGEHLFIESKRNWSMFIGSLTPLNLIKYIAPVLTVIISDWILKIFSQSKIEIPQGKKTFYVIVFTLTLTSIILMLIGLSFGANKYSNISIISTIIVLLLYFYSYCENPLYEDKGNPGAASGSNVDVRPSNLQGGGL